MDASIASVTLLLETKRGLDVRNVLKQIINNVDSRRNFLSGIINL